jgi:hypothetical protein
MAKIYKGLFVSMIKRHVKIMTCARVHTHTHTHTHYITSHSADPKLAKMTVVIHPQRYIYHTTEAFQIRIHNCKINTKRKIKYSPFILCYVHTPLRGKFHSDNRNLSTE